MEEDGTYFGARGQSRTIKKAVAAPDECKAPWEIFKELAAKMGQNWNIESSEQVMPEKLQFNALQFKPASKIRMPSNLVRTNLQKEYMAFCEGVNEVLQKK